MTKGDFALGCVLFAVPVLAAVTVGLAVARRVGGLDQLERAMAALLIGLGAYLTVHLVPLTLGVLSRGTVTAAALVAASGGAVLLGRPPAEPAPDGRPVGRPSDTVEWALVAVLAIPVAVAAVAGIRHWLPLPAQGVDSPTFHLPNVARWMESGSLWQIDQFVPLQAHGYYPNTGDVLHLAAMLPWDNDFAHRLPMILLFALLPLCVYAVARELGAPPAPSALFAFALAALPCISQPAIITALPDIPLYTGLSIGALFLLRHARTHHGSDLLLGALGLGIGFGTKWYGVSAVVVTVFVLLVAWLFAAHRAGGPLPLVVTKLGLVVGVIAASGGIWMLRNLVEVGNPAYPVKLSLLGLTIFDAPPDTVRAQVGFSIAHYATDFGVLRDLAGEYYTGGGGAPIGLGLAVIAAIVVLLGARRGRVEPPDRRITWVVATAVVLFAVYTITPFTALGLEGHPDEAQYNVRYSTPALMTAAVIAAWVAGRLPRWWSLALQVVTVAGALVTLETAFRGPSGVRSIMAAALVVAAATITAAIAVRFRTRLPAVVPTAAGAVAVCLVVGYGWRTQERLNDIRFRGSGDAVVVALENTNADRRPRRVAIAGDWNGKGVSPVWPSYGPFIDNHVEQLGYFRDGQLTNYGTLGTFRAALERLDPDLLVVGRGLAPSDQMPAPEEQWAHRLRWREVARSNRLVLYLPR